MRTLRVARSITLGSWVEKMKVAPFSRLSFSMIERIFSAVSESTFAVGSSARTTAGFAAMERAMATYGGELTLGDDEVEAAQGGHIEAPLAVALGQGLGDDDGLTGGAVALFFLNRCSRCVKTLLFELKRGRAAQG